jgi:hypothetical protein
MFVLEKNIEKANSSHKREVVWLAEKADAQCCLASILPSSIATQRKLRWERESKAMKVQQMKTSSLRSQISIFNKREKD